MNTKKDIIITTPMRTIKVDQGEINKILSEFKKIAVNPSIIPTGFFTTNEYAKMMHMGPRSARQYIKRMLQKGKMEQQKFRTINSTGFTTSIYYYKLKI